MYIITGAAGFIGSAFARKLNQENIDEIIIVDELLSSDKWKNLRKIKYQDFQHKDVFLQNVLSDKLPRDIKAIIHMGACSTTTEKNADYMMNTNYEYTKILAEYAVRNDIRFIYASSAATYGEGERGYDDNEDDFENLTPMNIYGYSKHLFDLYAQKNNLSSQIVGLKFFNVFGPNEYHKEDQRSVVIKSYDQIKETGSVKLFKSYKPEYKDGEQKRDFVYIKDCCDVMWWLLKNDNINGVFNLGTGQARSWNDLVNSVFKALKVRSKIEYIDMPDNLKNQYQYFTQANMSKLQKLGCPLTFRSLEDSVADYVCAYLENSDKFL